MTPLLVGLFPDSTFLGHSQTIRRLGDRIYEAQGWEQIFIDRSGVARDPVERAMDDYLQWSH